LLESTGGEVEVIGVAPHVITVLIRLAETDLGVRVRRSTSRGYDARLVSLSLFYKCSSNGCRRNQAS